MAQQSVYKILFLNQGKVYELYAERVFQADLYGFVTLESIVFGEKSSVVVDPQEEKIKLEFSGVSSTMIPAHLVLRIDQVEKIGVSTISTYTDKDNIMPFPRPFGPGTKKDDQ